MSRVRENLTHGSLGEGWKRGDRPMVTDLSPQWKPWELAAGPTGRYRYRASPSTRPPCRRQGQIASSLPTRGRCTLRSPPPEAPSRGTRVSDTTSLAIRRFGLSNTSAKSRLELRRGHGPAVRPPSWTAKGPSSCTRTTGSLGPSSCPSSTTTPNNLFLFRRGFARATRSSRLQLWAQHEGGLGTGRLRPSRRPDGSQQSGLPIGPGFERGSLNVATSCLCLAH